MDFTVEDFSTEASSLSVWPVVKIPSVISADGGEESSGSNSVTVSLLLDLLTHVECDGLGEFSPTVHCPPVLSMSLCQ